MQSTILIHNVRPHRKLKYQNVSSLNDLQGTIYEFMQKFFFMTSAMYLMLTYIFSFSYFSFFSIREERRKKSVYESDNLFTHMTMMNTL